MADPAVKETARKFGRHGTLFGIISEPGAARRGLALIILNAGIMHRAGPSRFSVGLARAAAAAGYRTLRFDLSGIGDSELAPEEGTLEQVVVRDIVDAIDLMDQGSGVVLAGICSGADNAFYVAADDARVRGLVLIDPTIPRTRGYYLRKNLQRLLSLRSWWNVVSGRSLYLRVRESTAATVLPPRYYGLLSCTREETIERARRMRARGVRFLYIITGGITESCNHPRQLFEAFPNAFSAQHLSVEWRPQMGHTLNRLQDKLWCERRIHAFLETLPGSRIECLPLAVDELDQGADRLEGGAAQLLGVDHEPEPLLEGLDERDDAERVELRYGAEQRRIEIEGERLAIEPEHFVDDAEQRVLGVQWRTPHVGRCTTDASERPPGTPGSGRP